MTYAAIVDYMEKKLMPKGFDEYKDKEEFEEDLDNAKNKLPGDYTARDEAFAERIDDWRNGNLGTDDGPSYKDYNDVDEKIRDAFKDKFREDIEPETQEEAQTRLDDIEQKDVYPDSDINEMQGMVNNIEPEFADDDLPDLPTEEEIKEEERGEVRDQITSLERAITVETIEDQLDDLPSIGEARRTLGRDFAEELSLAKAEAAERAFDLKTDEQKRALREGTTGE